MKTTPKQFAQLLLRSTLTKDEQQMILDLLPSLSSKQIDEIAKTLKKDVSSKKSLCKDIKKHQEKLHTDLVADLDKAELSLTQ